uniref:Uncharacterized protein n=1 Tax=Kalanchoe fedtschenkoi TaxID=63787 RepID=A0A7N0U9I0_KALFE
MEKARGTPEAVVEYSNDVVAVLSQLFAVSDDGGEMDQFGEEIVEKVMLEFWNEMKDFGAVAEEMDGFRESDEGAETAAAAMMVKVTEKQ